MQAAEKCSTAQSKIRRFKAVFFLSGDTCTNKGAKIEQRAEKAAKTGFYSLVVVPAFVVGWVPVEFYRGSLGYSGKVVYLPEIMRNTQ